MYTPIHQAVRLDGLVIICLCIAKKTLSLNPKAVQVGNVPLVVRVGNAKRRGGASR